MKTNTWARRITLVGWIAALALASIPLTNAYAAGAPTPAAMIAAQDEISDERLEQLWARQQRIYERQGQVLDRADGLIEKAQSLLDRAAENGKDVSALQAALDAFAEAIKDAHPIYESAKGIINSHKGFDGEGKVTDSEQAAQTVKEMAGKLQEVRELIGAPGKALHEALKAFREANKPEG